MKKKVKKLYIYIKLYLSRYFYFKPIRMNRMPKRLLLDYVKRNPVMIDCGAHDGKDTIELLELLGGEIHAFEALPLVFEKLKMNTKSIPNIKCYPLALSNVTDKVVFYVSSGESIGSSSLLPPKDHLVDHPDTKFEETITVDAITLDDWTKKYEIKKVDFMWLDMQGAEKLMLEASPKILKTTKAIFSEVSVKESYQGVTQYIDFKKWMDNQGFRVEMESIPAGWDCGDALFVRYKNN